MTDSHAQLLPGYFREPSVNLGLGAMRDSRRIWSAVPFSTGSELSPTAPTPMHSLHSVSKNPRLGLASSAVSRI